MRILRVLATLLLVAFPVTANAWTENYSWATAAGTTWNVYVCDWVAPAAPATVATPCAAWVKSNTAPLTSPAYTLTDANTVLTEVEVEACGTSTGLCSRRAGSGFFHDATRVPPGFPSNVVVQ